MYNCPKCSKTLKPEDFPCEKQYCLPPKYGVLRLLKEEFQQKLFEFEELFFTVREQEGVRIKDTSLFKKLPYLQGHKKYNFPEWTVCIADLAMIKKRLNGRKGLQILNYGSWNGWLSNKLVEIGHQVTAVSYFIDEYDGLGACQHYENDWVSIQMDIEQNLEVLVEKYDVIIMNRNVSFLSNPVKTISALKEKLVANGELIITAVNISNDSKKSQRIFQEHCNSFKQKHNFDLMLNPTKGYLDLSDHIALKQSKVRLFSYKGESLKNLLKKHLKKSTSKYYGVYSNE